MRITTFDDQVPGKRCSIEVPLRRRAAAADRFEAAYWRKLLDLAEHLRSSGPEPELLGHLLSRELWLSLREPSDAVQARQMQEFAEEWRARHPDQVTASEELRAELRRRFPGAPKTRVGVRADWQDYAPLRDGVPDMHYRFEVRCPGQPMSTDARTKDLAEAERILRDAFGWRADA